MAVAQRSCSIRVANVIQGILQDREAVIWVGSSFARQIRKSFHLHVKSADFFKRDFFEHYLALKQHEPPPVWRKASHFRVHQQGERNQPRDSLVERLELVIALKISMGSRRGHTFADLIPALAFWVFNNRSKYFLCSAGAMRETVADRSGIFRCGQVATSVPTR